MEAASASATTAEVTSAHVVEPVLVLGGKLLEDLKEGLLVHCLVGARNLWAELVCFLLKLLLPGLFVLKEGGEDLLTL